MADSGLFRFGEDAFALAHPPEPGDAETLAPLIHEISDWRLARYLDTKDRGSGRQVRGTMTKETLRVIRNSSQKPILFLRREHNHNLPTGRVLEVAVGSQTYTFDFMKVAVNIARLNGEGSNVLAELLTDWFGPETGASGKEHLVELWQENDQRQVAPVRRDSGAEGDLSWAGGRTASRTSEASESASRT